MCRDTSYKTSLLRAPSNLDLKTEMAGEWEQDACMLAMATVRLLEMLVALPG